MNTACDKQQKSSLPVINRTVWLLLIMLTILFSLLIMTGLAAASSSAINVYSPAINVTSPAIPTAVNPSNTESKDKLEHAAQTGHVSVRDYMLSQNSQ